MTGPAPLSGANPRIKRLRRLAGRRSSRSDEDAFVVEGPVLVREAFSSGAGVQEIYVDASHPELLAEFAALAAGPIEPESAPEVFSVEAGVLAKVLPAVSPQPVCAVRHGLLPVSLSHLVETAVWARRPLLVLVDVADPGNLGTLIRSAAAAGCAGVVLAGDVVDVHNPKVVRSSAGAVFRTMIAVADEVGAALSALAEAGVGTVATVVADGEPYDAVDLTGLRAFLIGSEAHGLPADVVAAADLRVTIPMEGRIESLNAAMAGTLLAFEAKRQRRVDAPAPE